MPNLKPPKTDEDVLACMNGTERAREVHAHGVEWYAREYRSGWAAAQRGGVPRKWDEGTASYAWEDGYLDAAAGREKWHLAYCDGECGAH